MEPMTNSSGSRQTRRGAGFRVGRNRGPGLVNLDQDQGQGQGADRNAAFQGMLMSGLTWVINTLGSVVGQALAKKLETAMEGRSDDIEKQKPAR